jgi:hypothetical protein
MKKQILFFTIISLFYTGCLVRQPKFTEKEKKIAEPLQNRTNYSDAFKKLDKLIQKYHRPNYRFQVKTIENLTSSKDILPIDSKSFIITPLILYMKHLKLLAYEPLFNRYETATTGRIYFPQMRKNPPQLVIGGGITQFDKGVRSESSNFDIDAEYGRNTRNSNTQADLRGDKDRSKSISQIALDLNVFRYKDRVYVPTAATKNKIEIHRIRKKNRLGFFLNGSGIGESKYSTLQQSKDEALRILTEYSLIQLLGRLYQVPYWTCTTPPLEPDELVIDARKDNFQSANKKNKQALIEQILPLYGYKNVKVDGKLSKNEQKMLLQIIQEYGLESNKVFSPNFYEELYNNIPSS